MERHIPGEGRGRVGGTCEEKRERKEMRKGGGERETKYA